MRRSVVGIAVVGAMVALVSNAFGSTPGADVRLSQDASAGGYVSAYTLGTGNAYTDPTLQECSISRGRQNEPAVGVDPRDTRVIIGSSNDYCGVYAPPGDPTTGNPAGPVWLGYYRSENSGSSFVSSLVPGYPGDVSPFASLAHIDTDSSGDPVIAWDAHGRAFMGSESDTGTDDSNGDVWVARYANSGGGTINDGKLYQGTVTVGQGSQSPFLLGKFNDKTAIEADHSGGPFDGNVYFAWARFTGGKISNIYFVRSTDHGVTFSKPMNLTPRNGNLQDPEISVTAGGDVYVTFDTFASNNGQPFGLWITKSTDGGQTFSPPTLVTTYLPVDAQDTAVSGGSARDCGSLSAACLSGYTFFRHTTSLRSTADQYDTAHQYVYLVYGAVKPGTELSTGTTFGIESAGVGGQETAYFVRYDGATGTHTAPVPLRNEAVGHQIFPDISADGGAPRDVVGHPERPDVLARAAAGQRRLRAHRPRARRLRQVVDEPRSQLVDACEDHRRPIQRKLRAVLESYGTVRRRLPVRELVRQLRLRNVDRLAERGRRHRPPRERRRRRGREAMPSLRSPHRDVRARHLSPRRRAGSEHLRRPAAITVALPWRHVGAGELRLPGADRARAPRPPPGSPTRPTQPNRSRATPPRRPEGPVRPPGA